MQTNILWRKVAARNPPDFRAEGERALRCILRLRLFNYRKAAYVEPPQLALDYGLVASCGGLHLCSFPIVTSRADATKRALPLRAKACGGLLRAAKLL